MPHSLSTIGSKHLQPGPRAGGGGLQSRLPQSAGHKGRHTFPVSCVSLYTGVSNALERKLGKRSILQEHPKDRSTEEQVPSHIPSAPERSLA